VISKLVKKLTRNFELPGLIFDMVFTATIFALSDAAIALMPAHGVMGSARETVLLFLYTFGLSNYLSNVYYEFARKYNTLNIFRFFKYGVISQLVVFLVLLMILAIVYSILSEFSTFTVSIVLMGLQGLLFGFAIGIELRFERDPNLSHQLEKAFRRRYDNSLAAFLPYLLVTVAIILPAELVLKRVVYRNAALLHYIVIALVCYGCYVIARWLERIVFVNLEIKKQLNTWTASVVSGLSAVAVSGFVLWEASVVNQIGNEDIKLLIKLLMLLLIGVIPIRVIHIVYSRSSVLNKTVAGAAITFFIVRKLIMLEWVNSPGQDMAN
jgi:hypothetical protein